MPLAFLNIPRFQNERQHFDRFDGECALQVRGQYEPTLLPFVHSFP
jgi:hypothetical protein